MDKHARTSPESELLLCCARIHVDPETLERVRALLRQELDWPYLIRTALDHGVMPLLYSSLGAHCPEAVPATSLDQLRNHYQAHVQRSSVLTAELLELLDLFEAHGIDAVPFKGPVVAAAVYRNLSLRPCGDLDVLVHKEDIPRAGELLVAHGYQSAGARFDHLEHDHDEVAYLDASHYLFIQPEHEICIDLQWRVADRYFSFSLDDDGLWKRRVSVSVAGKTVRTFAPADLLLLVCVHGSKHRWEALKWICDVAELVGVYRKAIDWRDLQREASRLGVEQMLRLGLFLAHDFFGTVLPEEISTKVRTDSRSQAMALEIRRRLFDRGYEPSGDVAKVVFYLRTKDRWQDRLRFCFRYLSQWLHIVITPTSRDRALLPVPAALSFVHYLVRPFRLTVERGRLGVARFYKVTRSAK